MEYKVVTINTEIDVKEELHETSIEKLGPLLKDGYKIVNFSCTHTVKNNQSSGDININPTKIFVVCSYLMSK